ncbi:M23 family metallopeptidase [soil metagenome]
MIWDAPLSSRITRRLAVALVLGLTAGSCTIDTQAPPPVVAMPAPPPPEHQGPCPPREVRLDGAARQGSVLHGQALDGQIAVSLNGRPVPLAPDRRFLIALDRDEPATATIRVTLQGTCGQFDKTLTIAPGKWDIQHVDASITGGVSSAEFKARRAAELERIAAARAKMTPGSSEGWRQDFIWPVVARISGQFGSQRIYRGTPGSYHSGVDLAAGAGATYVAPADGVVLLAVDAPFTLEGNLLMIDHGMGLNSAFLHSQRLLVKEGDVVRRGQPIGIVGATGRVTGPHLHWGMKWKDARLDPAALVQPDGR